jgi:protein-S-isoprenylcysteine O-methyltransferase Ste14
LQRPLWWIALFVIVMAQTVPRAREARVLEAAFGDAYREYPQKAWFGRRATLCRDRCEDVISQQ